MSELLSVMVFPKGKYIGGWFLVPQILVLMGFTLRVKLDSSKVWPDVAIHQDMI